MVGELVGYVTFLGPPFQSFRERKSQLIVGSSAQALLIGSLCVKVE